MKQKSQIPPSSKSPFSGREATTNKIIRDNKKIMWRINDAREAYQRNPSSYNRKRLLEAEAEGRKGRARMQADNKKWEKINEASQSRYLKEQETNPAHTSELQELQKLAQRGDAEAQVKLGGMYAAGKGVPANYKLARQWCRKAAEQGNTKAFYAIGFMYDQGRGVPQDYKLAMQWYKKAAEQGHANAQRRLAGMYEYGRGVPKNLERSMQWHRKANRTEALKR